MSGAQNHPTLSFATSYAAILSATLGKSWGFVSLQAISCCGQQEEDDSAHGPDRNLGHSSVWIWRGHPGFALDPAYLDVEKAALGQLGIEALTDPIRGFLEVDFESIVVSIDPDVPVKEIICDLDCRPAAILWIKQREGEENNSYVGTNKTISYPESWPSIEVEKSVSNQYLVLLGSIRNRTRCSACWRLITRPSYWKGTGAPCCPTQILP
ncbi:hypothetical protein C8A03DRAFT_19014 [Achaetomium macrosporum]|uniref:Uncharacterized protein n=1 Tax=Achaetomium macrosporum TaxID=79813 RepID=A0AAN7C2B9_9PEZI|nr:hypothetical protein C8A03DRAFT_19014 [Achaetomium macrosporum]